MSSEHVGTVVHERLGVGVGGGGDLQPSAVHSSGAGSAGAPQVLQAPEQHTQLATDPVRGAFTGVANTAAGSNSTVAGSFGAGSDHSTVNHSAVNHSAVTSSSGSSSASAVSGGLPIVPAASSAEFVFQPGQDRLLHLHGVIIAELDEAQKASEEKKNKIKQLKFDIAQKQKRLEELVQENREMQQKQYIQQQETAAAAKASKKEAKSKKRKKTAAASDTPSASSIVSQMCKIGGVASAPSAAAIQQRTKQRVDIETEIRDMTAKSLKMEEELGEAEDAVAQYLLKATPYLNNYHSIRAQMQQLTLHATAGMSSAERAHKLNQMRQQLAHLTTEFIKEFKPSILEQPKAKRSRKNTTSAAVEEEQLCDTCQCPLFDDNSGKSCPECGVVYGGFDTQPDGGTFESSRAMTSSRQFTYKQINHFRELLRQLQGKLQVNIPDIIIDTLRQEFRKCYQQPSSITEQQVRLKLKKLKLSKYYDHVPAITSKLNPTYKNLDIPGEHEELLCYLFMRTEEPYNNVKQLVLPERKRCNFMSYPFIIYKLSQLCGFDYILPHISLLKSTNLLIFQDRWWSQVCRQNNWPFMVTVGNTAMSTKAAEGLCLVPAPASGSGTNVLAVKPKAKFPVKVRAAATMDPDHEHEHEQDEEDDADPDADPEADMDGEDAGDGGDDDAEQDDEDAFFGSSASFEDEDHAEAQDDGYE